jgi:phytoene/squalene synthetase
MELSKFIHKNSYLKESFCHWADSWIRLLISNQDSWLNQAEFNHFIDDFNNSADLLLAECLLQMPLKHQLKEFVIAAGNAKTRVMFLRDFGEHVRNGHVFLPLNLLGEFDLTTQHLSVWRTEADARNWIEVSSFQAKFIDDLYIQATQWLNPLPINEQKKVWPLRAQLQLAMNTLKEIKQNDFAVISQKIETSPGKSMFITLGSRFFS